MQLGRALLPTRFYVIKNAIPLFSTFFHLFHDSKQG